MLNVLSDCTRVSLSIPASKQARDLAAEIVTGWPDDEPFDAEVVLDRHPELRHSRSAVRDLAEEEYLRAVETGQPPEPREFAERFPALGESLVVMLALHRDLPENSQVLRNLRNAEPAAGLAELAPGSRFLNFDLVEELGKGSFSRVFLAAEADLGHRAVVLKICQRGNHEAETLGRLEHPRIVPVYSVRTDPDSGLTAICMPFLSRTTLFDVLDAAFARPEGPESAAVILDTAAGAESDERQPPAESARFRKLTYAEGIARIGMDLAEALAFTHSRGICHSDIKPSNVLVTADGRARLLDFNLSFGRETSQLGGTLTYMPPEQLRAVASPGSGAVIQADPRSDIFSLGATLYELLTGWSPFGLVPSTMPNTEAARVLLVRQQDGPVPLRERNHRVDLHLAGVVERCLVLNPETRFQSATELVAALRRYGAPLERLRRGCLRSKRRLAGWASVTAGSTALALGVLSLDVSSSRAPQPNRRIEFPASRGESSQADSDVDALLDRGRACLERGELQHAFREFEAVVARRPDGRAYAAMAYCLCLMQRDRREAARLSEQAVEHGFSSAAVHNNAGYCYWRLGQFDKAEASIRKAVGLNPTHGVPLYHLAAVEWRHALRVKPGADSGTHIGLALDYIERAMAHGPVSAELLIDAACIYATAARSQKDSSLKAETYVESAVQHCQQALDRDGSPQKLKRVMSYLPALSSDPRFNELLRRPEPGKTPPQQVYVINPLAEEDRHVYARR